MLHKITSAANPTVKMLKTLTGKKGRQEAGLFLAEGARLAHEAAERGIWPDVMAVSESALERPYAAELAAKAGRAGARVFTTTDRVLEQIARRDNPQTIIGAYKQRWASLDDLSGSDMAVALHEVRDPGNLGTILRSCDATGASGVALIGQCCDPFSVEAVRASMGSIFATVVARAEFGELDGWRRAANFALIGTSLRATQRHDEAPLSERTMILMGNEQSGLPEALERACDRLVKIPMRGSADSLNLAMATTVMLYDVWRRRGYAGA
ncbi:MAG: TrmH family RNA methyltransferase [Hyphomonadaceae bacterium]